MRLPPHLHIFGHKYKIKAVDAPSDDSGPNRNLYGVCNPKDQIIEISKNLKGHDLDVTLVHEMMHAIAFRQSWDQVIDEQFIELVADHTGKAICENFKLSPLNKN